MLFVNIEQNIDWAGADCVLLGVFEHSIERILILTIKNTHPKLCRLWVFSGTAELTIRSIQIFFSHFEESQVLCFISSWKIARAANPTRALQTYDNELQRAPVISYEELSGDRRPLFQ